MACEHAECDRGRQSGPPADCQRGACCLIGPQDRSDILTFEQRGEDFALIRMQADGSRSEIVLTATNVVHLGLLAPGFARQVLTDKVGQQPGHGRKDRAAYGLNANLRFIEILLTILDRGGARFDFPTTERRARALASKLVERADRIASAPKPAKELNRSQLAKGAVGDPQTMKALRQSVTMCQ